MTTGQSLGFVFSGFFLIIVDREATISLSSLNTGCHRCYDRSHDKGQRHNTKTGRNQFLFGGITQLRHRFGFSLLQRKKTTMLQIHGLELKHDAEKVNVVKIIQHGAVGLCLYVFTNPSVCEHSADIPQVTTTSTLDTNYNIRLSIHWETSSVS